MIFYTILVHRQRVRRYCVQHRDFLHVCNTPLHVYIYLSTHTYIYIYIYIYIQNHYYETLPLIQSFTAHTVL